MTDARFEDGDESPLRLIARDAEGLGVMAALVQDAVFPITEMRYDRTRRRFALLVNRFRWEDRAAAEAAARPYERVRALMLFDGVLAVRSQGIDRSDKDMILSLLDCRFEGDADGAGTVTLTLAGDGAVVLQVEALDVALNDVTRPYRAPSGKVPDHGA